MTWTARRAGVVTALAVTVIGVLASIGLDVANTTDISQAYGVADAFLVFAWTSLPVAGAVVLWHRERHPVGRLLVVMGLFGAAKLVSHGWAVWALRTHPGALGGTFAAALDSWLSIPAVGLLVLIPALLPDGCPGRRMSLLTRVAAGALAVMALAQAVAADHLDGVPRGIRPIPNPLGVEALTPAARLATAACVITLLLFGAVSVIDLIRRFRAAEGEIRQQLRWLASACAVLPLSIVLTVGLDLAGAQQGAEFVLLTGQVGFLIGLSTAMGVAVLRYRLWDLDLVLRRSAVLAAVTAALAGVYIGTVAFVGYALAPEGGVATVLATVVVAIVVQPLHKQVKSRVERWVLRGRHEPYAVLTALADRVELARAPEDALADLLDTVARELRRPWVRLDLAGATRDTADEAAERFAVTHHGSVLGELVVGLRRPGERLEPEDRQLLGTLARQAGALVAAVRMERELQQSSERLLVEREAERARLRRELHDGLGPTLASMTLRVDVATDGVEPESEARRQLDAVSVGLRTAVDEVRRIVDDLRPPELDTHGLVHALRQRFESLPAPGGGAVGLCVTVEADGVERLPTAVELALYRIAGEAVTNVVRHAEARHCRVSVRRTGDEIALEVVDDGVGLGGRRESGVGLRSMRERAHALGGCFDVAAEPHAGTRVRVVVPVSV